MSKDPAMLWYWNDWNGGTMTLSRHLKGCYMDLLSAQFNSGPLSLDQIKTVLGTDKALWDILSKKFRKEVNSDGIEVFFNERMETEKNRRAENSLKQKEKVNKRWDLYRGIYRGNTIYENENENKEEKKEGGVGEEKGEGFFCNEIPKDMQLTNIEILSIQEFISITVKKNISESEIKDYWQAFKINQFTQKEWYKNREALLKHFRHSLKLELQKQKSNGSISKQQSQRSAVETAIRIGENEFAALRKKHTEG